MKRTWEQKELNSPLPTMPEYPAMVLKLLALRGITKEEEIRDFLNPDYAKLLDPFIFKDMQLAVDRIWKAIEAKEKITIYSDYDADAITACSVMYLALTKVGGRVSYYIPDRFSEGYGMNVEAIQKIQADGGNLIITVDCGINALVETVEANKLGMDVIITDHHELTGELPKAFAIINPKNPNDNYPYQYLTGVGVAFKVVQALYKSQEARVRNLGVVDGWEKWLLDLVAIGTVADCQSLVGENRILVSFGLKVLQKTMWPGLRALLAAAAARTPYDAFTLGFVVAPRINAAGRIKHADLAFRLLISENILEAQNLALELNELNKHRQLLTEQIVSEARSQLELVMDRKVLLAAGVNWPKGVVGLVAGRLAEEFNRPVLILDKTESHATGSARSTENFDMVMALTNAKDLLVKYGGHKQAAGFTLESTNIDAFYASLLQFADSQNFDVSDPVLRIDAEISGDDLNFETLDYVEKLAPFGFGNSKPKFLTKQMEVIDTQFVGAKSQHVRIRLRINDKIFTAIAFNQPFLGAKLKAGDKIDMVYELSSSEWNGLRQMDLKIIDVETK